MRTIRKGRQIGLVKVKSSIQPCTRKKRRCRAPFNPKKDQKKDNESPGVCKPQSLYNNKDRTWGIHRPAARYSHSDPLLDFKELYFNSFTHKITTLFFWKQIISHIYILKGTNWDKQTFVILVNIKLYLTTPRAIHNLPS